MQCQEEYEKEWSEPGVIVKTRDSHADGLGLNPIPGKLAKCEELYFGREVERGKERTDPITENLKLDLKLTFLSILQQYQNLYFKHTAKCFPSFEHCLLFQVEILALDHAFFDE